MVDYKKYPWKKTLVEIKTRCNNKNHHSYKYYGGKGIKCLITSEELKELWFRDKVYLLKQPSINRLKHNKNYEFFNCEYIEKGLNSSERNKRILSKPILQYDLKGNFIKEWKSQRNINRQLNIPQSSISDNCNGKFKQTHGFVFKFKN